MQLLERLAAAWLGAVLASPAPARVEQLVFVTAACAHDDASRASCAPAMVEFEAQLRQAIGSARVHRVEARAWEIAIWIYGADAEVTWGQASKVVLTSPLTPSGYVLLRHGGPGAFERQIEFSH